MLFEARAKNSPDVTHKVTLSNDPESLINSHAKKREFSYVNI